MIARTPVLERNQLLIESAELRAARRTAAAYNQARRELVDELLAGWVRMGTGAQPLSPEGLADVFRRSGLVRQIDARLRQLEAEYGVILRDTIRLASELAYEQVERELGLLPPSWRAALRPFAIVDTAMVETIFPASFQAMRQALGYVGTRMEVEFAAGLAKGESFPDLVKRLIGATREDGQLWRRGRVSAELGVRRTTIHANNAARVDYYRQAQAEVPELQKQAVAVISPETTDCCLRVHGQIRALSEPFELTGTPRFQDYMDHSPFHWSCRTAVVAYHPLFERGGMTTASMERGAKAELRRRDTSTGTA